MARMSMMLLALLAASAHAQSELSVTVYSSAGPGALDARMLRSSDDGSGLPGYALVREHKQISVPAGVSEVRISDVPELVDPATVQLRSDPSLQVLSQRYQFDLGSTRRLLRQYVGEEVEVDLPRAGEVVSVRGKLLGASDGLALEQGDGSVRVVRDYVSIRLPPPKQTLSTAPTLTWSVRAPKGGPQPVDLSYESGGWTWWAEYHLTYREQQDQCTAELGAFATIVNRSGRTYVDATLHLVAGKPNRAAHAQPQPMQRAMMLESAPAPGVAEQPLAEYHLYSLERPLTLVDGAVQQVRLLARSTQVKCHQELVFGAQQWRGGAPHRPIIDPGYEVGNGSAVRGFLEFDNRRSNALGVPLPAGRVRITQAAQNGVEQFVGEDNLYHTPVDETVRLALGESFDVVGERRQQDFSVDNERRVMEEQIEIRLRNHKAAPVLVQVTEQMARWRQWQITEASQDYNKIDAATVRFPVSVPAKGEAAVRYRVRYTW